MARPPKVKELKRGPTAMDVFGATRSRIRPNYALLTPDTHVVAPLVDWKHSSAIVHISPEIGARFLQYTAIMHAGSQSGMPNPTVQRLVYVLSGKAQIDWIADAGRPSKAELRPGGFVYFPAGTVHAVAADDVARLLVIEKVYQRSKLPGALSVVVGREEDLTSQPFLGDPDARLQNLLPDDPAFDMAVNIFTYQPGATLPQVEIHVMEHGLLMLQGAGVYRLGDDYFPVTAGDTIWMASYCPQWFVAMGKQPARYIYYKDVHRDGLEHRS
jgi:(S)-ureidoglycine aminohydrolase